MLIEKEGRLWYDFLACGALFLLKGVRIWYVGKTIGAGC